MNRGEQETLFRQSRQLTRIVPSHEDLVLSVLKSPISQQHQQRQYRHRHHSQEHHVNCQGHPNHKKCIHSGTPARARIGSRRGSFAPIGPPSERPLPPSRRVFPGTLVTAIIRKLGRVEPFKGEAYANESLPRGKEQCSRLAEKRCSAATAYAALQGSEDELVAEHRLESEEAALKTPGSETEDTEDNGAQMEEPSSPGRRFTFLRRFRSPRFGEAHHKRVPTPMKRKHRRKRSKDDIIDNDVNDAGEEPPSPDQGGVPDPYYPIYLPIDQAFKAKYVFHHKKGKTFQERLYVFLEHPGGWLCIVYHLTVVTVLRGGSGEMKNTGMNNAWDKYFERRGSREVGTKIPTCGDKELGKQLDKCESMGEWEEQLKYR
ncbi:hypothetical protein KM043_005279 [Ampulex compressa]|nr:hypothetical protein KM043_005279 [Ampulex compressa]